MMYYFKKIDCRPHFQVHVLHTTLSSACTAYHTFKCMYCLLDAFRLAPYSDIHIHLLGVCMRLSRNQFNSYSQYLGFQHYKRRQPWIAIHSNFCNTMPFFVVPLKITDKSSRMRNKLEKDLPNPIKLGLEVFQLLQYDILTSELPCTTCRWLRHRKNVIFIPSFWVSIIIKHAGCTYQYCINIKKNTSVGVYH